MVADLDAARSELEELYGAWFEAITARDLLFFERTLAPDWHYVDTSGGTRDKASYISYVAGLPASVRLKDAHLGVRLFGPLALVAGTYEIERAVEGLSPRSSTRFTAVWQCASGSWQALAHHATTIQERPSK